MDRLRHLLLMLTALLCLGCNGDKDVEPRILTTEDLSQVRMATVISTVGEDYVLRNFPDQEPQGYDDILGPIEALKTKRVDDYGPHDGTTDATTCFVMIFPSEEN